MDKSKRLSPTSETIKLVLLRSGNECAFPGCSSTIFNDQNRLIAQCCHIEAALTGGERFNPLQSDEDRRSPDNLIFLCYAHHIETNNTEIYTVAVLKKIKADHEKRFKDKILTVHPNYIQQIQDSFEEIKNNTRETVDVVNRIEAKQEEIFNLLNTNNGSGADSNYAFEFFGAPAVHQFKGRENNLRDLQKALPNFNTVQVGGISGIGKTSFISAFLNIDKSLKCLWVNCETTKTKEAFLLLLAKFTKQELKDSGLENSLKQLSTEDALNIMLSVFNKHCVYVVFDALNSGKHDLFSVVEIFNRNVTLSKIIFSTHQDLESFAWTNPVHKILLKGIDEENFVHLFSAYGIGDVDQEAKLKLYHLLNGHPFLLKLTATISTYQPIETFISNLENESIGEVSKYVREKVLKFLSAEEIEFLEFVSIMDIPFRYSITDFLLPGTSTTVLQSLFKKFLIEIRLSSWYEIPEFIKNHISSSYQFIEKKDVHRAAVSYLKSLNSDVKIFERVSLINHAIECDELDTAKKVAQHTLSSLMGAGEFNLAFRIANDFKNTRVEGREFLYYTIGRINRFNEKFESSLKMYETAIEICSNDAFKQVLKFEKASLLIFLSDESEDEHLKQDAIKLYEELATSGDFGLAIQSQSVLAQMPIRDGNYSQGIQQLEALFKTIKEKPIQENISASLWQILGEAYAGNGEYQKAIDCFDKSFDYYHQAIPKFGMNVIDGLFHLYQSLGWTYSKAGEEMEAARIFSIATGLCYQFGLTSKLQKSLFDLGYRLILLEKYHEACKALSDYYGIIVKEDSKTEEIDMRLVFGSLTFAHWYDGQYLDAVELLALYILACASHHQRPAFSIAEEEGIECVVSILSFFKKHIYLFIIPKGKTFVDFKLWVKTVAEKRPELSDVLNSFHFFKPEDGKF